MRTKITRSIHHLLTHCGSLRSGERVAILCDPSTADMAAAFQAEAMNLTNQVRLLELETASRHGGEPPTEARILMRSSDLILSLCKYSLAHSGARIDAGRQGARFLSMPLYTWELLESPVVNYDFKSRAGVVRRVADALTEGTEIHVRGRAGTDILLNAEGRVGNCCPGFVENPGELGSPPDIEANVSPLEDRSEGIAVIDGSITCPEIGRLETPVRAVIENGSIRRFESSNRRYVEVLEHMFGPQDSKRRTLAECGVGLNPEAKLTGTMLTDEGAYGSMHLGFGSNHTVGGRNEVDFHLDFVFNEASLTVDGRDILRNGTLVE